MRLKSELYKKEQEEITDKIINILGLDDKNSTILYNLDNNKDKQNKILELIPDIKKYYSFTISIGASDPTKAKRPYVSIIRQFTKTKYNMISSDYKIKTNDDKIIRTKKYTFVKN
jgi:hypothetical protein